MQTIYIDDIPIGDGHPTYIIAEVAGNFTTEKEARQIVDAAIRAGVSAVKFQTLDPDTITTKSNRFNMESVGSRSQYDVFAEARTPVALQHYLVEYCREKHVTVFTAPSHVSDLPVIEELNVPAYKIGSDLATHIPLLQTIARMGKPIILSTGMCTMEEIHESVDAIREQGNEQIALFHCIANYPGIPQEQNLKAMVAIKNEFGYPTGFSDHTIGIDVSIGAVALGANMIERHFWCDGNFEGCDRILSSDEAEMTHLVTAAENVRSSLGTGIKEPSQNEKRNMITNRISIVAMKSLPANTILDETMIDIRRPATGLPPKYWNQLIGSRLVKGICKEEPLTPEHLEHSIEFT